MTCENSTQAASQSEVSSVHLGHIKLLVADDQPINLKVVSAILEPFGTSIVAVHNGAEAVAAFERDEYDLVLMDMQMPEMDGLSATRAIRAFENRTGRLRTPIAMLSANAMKEHVEDALAVGCDEHIAKPINPQGLIIAISRLLELHGKNRRVTAA